MSDEQVDGLMNWAKTIEASGLPQIVLPSGKVRGGFAAVTRVAEILPVGYLWAPLLRLPPIALIGEALYRRVAERRSCELPVATRTVSQPRSS